jgi:hypothetical protein
MTMETKKNIFEEHLRAWLKAKRDKKKRGEIIRHMCFVAGVHPKSVPRSFRRVQMRDHGIPERRGRHVVYGAPVNAALKEISDAASHPCGENLQALIPEYVRILRRDGMWRHDEEATLKLLAMSMATVKRKALKFSHIRKMVRGRSTTKPGSVKSLIPVRSGPWDDAPAGTMQIDTVAHCGDTVAGDFVYTVNATDVATLWGARRAQWNKGQDSTVKSMEAMSEDLHFNVLEWHPDSGSEFVNWHCKRWAKERGQKLTRSRPNHKNDNCFVEERNGHIVRKWIGYARFEHPDIVARLNHLYDILTPYLNHFSASRRTVKKERIGARWKITREQKSRTPYERVMARRDVSDEIKTRIMAKHDELNPLTMKIEVEKRAWKLYDMQKHRGKPELRAGFR